MDSYILRLMGDSAENQIMAAAWVLGLRTPRSLAVTPQITALVNGPFFKGSKILPMLPSEFIWTANLSFTFHSGCGNDFAISQNENRLQI